MGGWSAFNWHIKVLSSLGSCRQLRSKKTMRAGKAVTTGLSVLAIIASGFFFFIAISYATF